MIQVQKHRDNVLSLNYSILEGDARDRLKDLPDNSVHLIVTSPPYGQIKQYSARKNEIGHNQTLQDYHSALNQVWDECVRVLHPGCRMIINVGDEFVQSTQQMPYNIIPHQALIISNITERHDDIIFMGTIHWEKVTTSKTSGGGKIMGSVYTPRDGHFFVNYEHIMVFKKLGKGPKSTKLQKELSRFTLEERRVWFKDTWQLTPERQDVHIAMFPMELPERFIQMYSYAGETVLDPFMGSGTTMAAAAKHGRSAIGVELGFGEGEEWKTIINNKVSEYLVDGNEILYF